LNHNDFRIALKTDSSVTGGIQQKNNKNFSTMAFSNKELQKLAFRSKSLYERGDKISKSSPLFDDWVDLIADGDYKRFSRRFKWDDHLSRKNSSKQNSLPSWTKRVNPLLEFIEKQTISPSSNKKFHELLLPFVLYAQKKLNISSTLIEKKAFKKLEKSLLKKFEKLFSQTFQVEFKVFKIEKSFSHPNLTSKYFYKSFIQSFTKERWKTFFKEYCVGIRLVFQIIDFWHDSIRKLSLRLERDFPLLQKTFSQKKLGKVISIEITGSDPHRRGKEVLIICFSSGCKIVYKPKSLKIDIAYFFLLSSIQKKEPLFSFKILKTIARKNYGWTEFISFKPCASFNEVQQFYFNAGSLTCLIYLLRGTDCHLENLIASGSYPILIDLETLFQPKMPSLILTDPNTLKLTQSVIGTGLLPFKQSETETVEMSGLTGFFPKGKNSHLPSFEGKKVSAQNFIPEIEDGFQKMYIFLLNHQKEILNFLKPFKKVSCRMVFRDTYIYEKLLLKSLSPDCLRDGLFRSKTIDILSRPLLFSQKRSPLWLIISKEHKDLNHLDIPYFNFSSSSLTLESSPRFFLVTGFNKVKKNLFSLSKKDLHFQLNLISSSLKTRFSKKPSKKIPIKNEKIFSSEEIQNKAIDIGNSILDQRIKLSSSYYWVQVGQSTKFPLLEKTDFSLYNGSGGIALFLSALYSLTKDDRFAKGAISSLKHLRSNISKEPIELEVNAIGLGGLIGLGSYIYTLTKVGQFLQKPEYYQDAQMLTHLITPRRIEKDTFYDIMGGSAGTILALLALHAIEPHPHLIKKAHLLAKHLLSHNNQSLTGFAHGASGIAYALLKLYQRTKEKKYLTAAEKRLIYENSHFYPEKNNWRDLRSRKLSFMVAWCHGAIGIGLCRLGSLSILDSFKKDLEAALLTAQNTPICGVDHLCCGNFSRLDFLSSAAHLLSREDLLSFSQNFISFLLAQEKRRGYFSLFNPPYLQNFSFFRGISGIGYTLLRYLYPEKYPSILLLE
jgi:lantibiotic modifying enzyme